VVRIEKAVDARDDQAGSRRHEMAGVRLDDQPHVAARH
jgi:hypothetical protein